MLPVASSAAEVVVGSVLGAAAANSVAAPGILIVAVAAAVEQDLQE